MWIAAYVGIILQTVLFLCPCNNICIMHVFSYIVENLLIQQLLGASFAVKTHALGTTTLEPAPGKEMGKSKQQNMCLGKGFEDDDDS